MAGLSADPKFPGVPAIVDEKVLAPSLKIVVENVNILTGAVGQGLDRAVRKYELDELADLVADLATRVTALE